MTVATPKHAVLRAAATTLALLMVVAAAGAARADLYIADIRLTGADIAGNSARGGDWVVYRADISVLVKNSGAAAAPVSLDLQIAPHLSSSSGRRFSSLGSIAPPDASGIPANGSKTYYFNVRMEWSPGLWTRGSLRAVGTRTGFTGFAACDGTRPYCFDIIAVVDKPNAVREGARGESNNIIYGTALEIKPYRSCLGDGC